MLRTNDVGTELSKDNNSRRNIMPKNTADTKPVPENKFTAAPSFKSFVKLCGSEDRPRGIKAAVNADGGVTFNYGPKSAPVAVIASKDELVALGITSLGVKLSALS